MHENSPIQSYFFETCPIYRPRKNAFISVDENSRPPFYYAFDALERNEEIGLFLSRNIYFAKVNLCKTHGMKEMDSSNQIKNARDRLLIVRMRWVISRRGPFY